MTRLFAALSALVLAGVIFTGCGSPPEQAAPAAPAAGKAAGTIYICHMGADCGKSLVAAGQPLPSCCGKVMVKADAFCCDCGKTAFLQSGKPAPDCCGKAMKAVHP